MAKYTIAGLLLVFSFNAVFAEPAGETYVLKQKFPAGTYKITTTTQSEQIVEPKNEDMFGTQHSSLIISTVTFSQPDDSGNQTIQFRLNKYFMVVEDGPSKRVVDSDVDFQKTDLRYEQALYALLFHNTAEFRYQPDGSITYLRGLDDELDKKSEWKTANKDPPQ